MIAEAGCSVIVREPAIPELPLIIGGYSGSDKNNVETVEFQEWCKTEIDMALKSKALDWEAVAEKHKAIVEGTGCYAKIKICDLPGDRDLFLMCWPPRVSTRIHGHPGDGCVHNLLEGKLVETLYHGEDSVGKYHTILPGKGSVFINDDIGFHKIENPDSGNWAYSLHLYPKVREL